MNNIIPLPIGDLRKSFIEAFTNKLFAKINKIRKSFINLRFSFIQVISAIQANNNTISRVSGCNTNNIIKIGSTNIDIPRNVVAIPSSIAHSITPTILNVH
jgi:hypothetical protein